MKSSHIVLASCLAVSAAGVAHAGAPQPDQRQGEFVHVCQGGPNKSLPCTIPTEDTNCPKSACVLQTLSRSITGRLTLIAHDSVTDWLHGTAGNQAATVLLEVKAPDGSKQMLAASYQDLTTPTNPPEAPGNIFAIPLNEANLHTLSSNVGGLLFVQPESTLSQALQTLFNVTGTPVIVAAGDRTVEAADHTGDNLASVLRFKVKVQFVDPL